MRNLPIAFIALAGIAGIVLSGCKGPQATATGKNAPTQSAGTPVAVTPARIADITETVQVTGTLQPENQVSVSPHIAGKVVWIIEKAGTPVSKGEVVTRLDPTDATIQLRTALSSVEAAKARVQQAKAAVVQQVTATSSGIQTAQAAVDAARARLQQTNSSYTAEEATSKAQIAQAAQALSAANSRYDELKNGARPQEKLIAVNNKRLAEATLQNDQATNDRLSTLYQQGAVSKAQLDEAATAKLVAKAQYDSAVQQLSMVNEGPRQEDIDGAKAAVEQAQAALDAARAGAKQVDVARDDVHIAQTGVDQAQAGLASARAAINTDVMRDKDVLAAQVALQQAYDTVSSANQALANTKVTSPVDGVVAQKLVEVGQSIAANIGTLEITTNSALYFETEVSELDATSLRAGQPVRLLVDALQGDHTNMYVTRTAHPIAGTIERIVPVVDAHTRNFTVRVVVAKSAALYPGMFARGLVTVADHRQIIAIARDAVIDKDGDHLVFVAQGNKAQQRQVTLGASDGTIIQVISGVTAGEQVVTTGQQTLLDGDSVSVTK